MRCDIFRLVLGDITILDVGLSAGCYNIGTIIFCKSFSIISEINIIAISVQRIRQRTFSNSIAVYRFYAGVQVPLAALPHSQPVILQNTQYNITTVRLDKRQQTRISYSVLPPSVHSLYYIMRKLAGTIGAYYLYNIIMCICFFFFCKRFIIFNDPAQRSIICLRLYAPVPPPPQPRTSKPKYSGAYPL